MKKNKLAVAIIISLCGSILLGALLQNNQGVAELFSPLGTIYVNLIKMIMIPLVVSSLILGISSMTDLKKIGKMGIATVVIFMVTTAFSVLIGIILSNVFKPGVGISIANEGYEAKQLPSIAETLTGIFPSNIFVSLTDGSMLQIIFVSIIVGIALVKIAPKGENFKAVIDDVFEIMCIITKGVMALTPLGILGLMVPTVAKNGLAVLLPLIKVILVFYCGVVIQTCVTYCIMIRSLSDFSVKEFFKKMYPAQVVAFVTCSSAAALPVSLKCMQEDLKVSKETAGFVLPLGNTINMDGNALYQGIVALFIAQAFGIDLSISSQIIIVLTGTLASIGAAGVPGAGMIVLSTVLASVGLPIEGIAIVAGIDRILDMGRTLMNVTSDAVTAAIIEKNIMKTGR